MLDNWGFPPFHLNPFWNISTATLRHVSGVTASEFTTIPVNSWFSDYYGGSVANTERNKPGYRQSPVTNAIGKWDCRIRFLFFLTVFSRLLCAFCDSPTQPSSLGWGHTVDFKSRYPRPSRTGTRTLRLAIPALSSYLFTSGFSRTSCSLVTYPFPAMLWSLSAFPPQVRKVVWRAVVRRGSLKPLLALTYLVARMDY